MTIKKTSNRIRAYARLRKEIREALRRQHPEWVDSNGKSPLCDSYETKRLGQPEDIADDVIAFLVSAGARWITGAVVRVDGGSHL